MDDSLLPDGDTYNAYINRLRIDHFVRLYREAAKARRPFTVFKLAHECGYRSYLGFYTAFRQRMGTSVMAWTRSEDYEPLDRSISGCLLP